jgi:hypothetical protein
MSDPEQGPSKQFPHHYQSPSKDLIEKDLTGKGLIENIKCSVLRYKALFRNIVIVWSSMLQCRYWHFAPLNTDPIIDQKCRRVNSAVRTFVIENGC